MMFENSSKVVNAAIMIIAEYDRLEFLTYNPADSKKSVEAKGLIKRMKYWKIFSIPKLKSAK